VQNCEKYKKYEHIALNGMTIS